MLRAPMCSLPFGFSIWNSTRIYHFTHGPIMSSTLILSSIQVMRRMCWRLCLFLNQLRNKRRKLGRPIGSNNTYKWKINYVCNTILTLYLKKNVQNSVSYLSEGRLSNLCVRY
jgi:hypothetical protein